MASDKPDTSRAPAPVSRPEAPPPDLERARTKSARSGTYLYAGDFLIAQPTKHNRMRTGGSAQAAAEASPLQRRIDPLFGREEVRLDIDGDYRQMAISGTGWSAFALVSHWVARLTPIGPDSYQGLVFYTLPAGYKDTDFCLVTVLVGNDPVSGNYTLDLVFDTDTGTRARSYAYQSPHFHQVELEYDYVTGVVPVTSFETWAHPNRPSTLAHEILDIATVFDRAGFEVTMSGGDSEVGLAEAESDALWTDQELHDSMIVHWSRYADKPQWAIWALFATQHHQSWGGVMFDQGNYTTYLNATDYTTYLNPYERQGVAIFENSFIGTAPAGEDPNDAAAWAERMRLWTAVHELGHALNLGHSWEGSFKAKFWIPDESSPDTARTLTFMNHPFFFADGPKSGQQAYFQNFEFRFSDTELLFLRHAPSRFVEPGGEAFMTNYAFQKAASQSPSDFELRLSTTAPKGRFAYLAPPVIEVALVNRGAGARSVPGSQLADQPGLIVMIGADDQPARQWLPYLRHCGDGRERVLQPGEALHDSILVGAGRTGWLMTRPGRYGIQAVLRVGDELVFSNPLTVTVEAPASRAEERLAVDFFTPEVGRVLAVSGSRGGDGVNAVLAKALELKDNPVSKLAAMALALPLSLDFKLLEYGPGEGVGARQDAGKRFATYPADPAAVRRLLAPAIAGGAEGLIDAMGHARFLREAPPLAGMFDEKTPRGIAAFDYFKAAGAGAGAAILPVGREFAAMLARKGASLAR